jgi:hypothetical protein
MDMAAGREGRKEAQKVRYHAAAWRWKWTFVGDLIPAKRRWNLGKARAELCTSLVRTTLQVQSNLGEPLFLIIAQAMCLLHVKKLGERGYSILEINESVLLRITYRYRSYRINHFIFLLLRSVLGI